MKSSCYRLIPRIRYLPSVTPTLSTNARLLSSPHRFFSAPPRSIHCHPHPHCHPISLMSSSRPARNLPASIVLPPTKKRKQEDENVREDDDDDDEAEEQRAATARAAAASATASSHNTPSPSFFATSSPRRTDARITFNNPPPTITPKYLTRVRHAKQLVIISSNPKHNEKPYKTEKTWTRLR